MPSKLFKKIPSPLLSIGALAVIALVPVTSFATVVEFETSQGSFQVNLYDKSTPATVVNFLSYVSDGSYNDTIIHRSLNDFIVQGGGFTYDGQFDFVKNAALPKSSAIVSKSAVVNEPIWSNVTATIAMAKLPYQADSATNQWFFNLKDNSANLDLKNSGFTVFGQVIGDGMAVVNKIAGLTTCWDVPMAATYTANDCKNKMLPGNEDMVTIYSVTVIDDAIDSADPLSKVKNTLLTVAPPKESSGGGSMAWISLLTLGLLGLRRKSSL